MQLALSPRGRQTLEVLNERLDRSSMGEVSIEDESLKLVLDYIDQMGDWPDEVTVGYIRQLGKNGYVEAVEE